jgi:hypothetical protein
MIFTIASRQTGPVTHLSLVVEVKMRRAAHDAFHCSITLDEFITVSGVRLEERESGKHACASVCRCGPGGFHTGRVLPASGKRLEYASFLGGAEP